MKKSTFTFLILLVGILVLPYFFIGLSKSSSLNNKSQPEILGPVTLKQTFISGADHLSQINLSVHTFDRENTEPLIFRLYSADDPDHIIREVIVSVDHIENDGFVEIKFDPINGSNGKNFYFSLMSPTSTPGNAVSVNYIPNAQDFNHSLFLNNTLIPAALNFRLVYDQGEILQAVVVRFIIGLVIIVAALVLVIVGLRFGHLFIKQGWQANLSVFVMYLGLTCLSYFLFFSSDYFFLFDDFALVHIGRTEHLVSIFKNGLIGFYRPLAFLMFTLEFKLWQWDYPTGYGLANLLLLLTSSFLLFLIMKELSQRNLYSFFIGALFATHFRHSEAISWISGRFDALATTFYLMAFYFYVLTPKKNKTLYFGLSMIFFVFSLLTKEMAITFPLVMILLEALIYRKNITYSGVIKKVLVRVSIMILIVILYVFVRQNAMKGEISAYGNVFVYLTPMHILETYHRYTLSLLQPYFFPDFAKIIGITLTVLFLLQIKMKNHTALFFAIAFLVSLIPVLPFNVYLTCTVSERFVYLPSIFFSGLIVSSLFSLEKFFVPLQIKQSYKELIPITLLVLYVWLNMTGLYIINQRWLKAGRVSKQVMLDFQEDTKAETNTIIYNLPQNFVSGPFVLKEYAFAYYFYGENKPSVQVANFVQLEEINNISGPLVDPLATSNDDKLVLNFDSKHRRLVIVNR